MLGLASFGLQSQGESRNRHESITERQYLNILQSMGQSAHIFDLDANIIYWNQSAEKLYGYTVQEALGHNVIELLADVQHYQCAANIIDRLRAGESWTGQFPVKSKTGEKFVVIATNKPFHDDDGTFIGIICVSTDTRNFQETRAKPFPKQFEAGPSFNGQRGIACSNIGLDPQHRPHVAIASKLLDLASKVSNKVKSKMRSGDNIIDRRGDLTSRRDSPPSIFGVFFPADSNVHFVVKHRRDYSDEESEVKPGIQKFIISKVKAWKGNEEGGSEPSRVGQPESAVKPESQLGEFNRTANLVEPWISSPPFNVNSTSSTSICATTTSTTQLDVGSDGSDYEISWEDLKIGEQIGQGCCGTVYHGLWFRSDVAIKVFSGQEYSDDLILSFKQEVSLMMRLRHPNILLFMGAITSPQRLCIVTEFLPRGSLFQLLHKSKSKLDWKRLVHMALDIARGVNYLHHCNPPIVHRDLKSSNLLVDKNWSVKVGDFGLSRLKHETFLKTKTAKGTPQWMAPEVIRAEPSNEKSDVYSFGVLLWELVTQKIPWDNLNSMQVIGAVGFMDQRLDIPKDIDPQWAAMIESCWRSDPQLRPTFEELLQKLKNLNRQCALAARSATGNSSNQKEL